MWLKLISCKEIIEIMWHGMQIDRSHSFILTAKLRNYKSTFEDLEQRRIWGDKEIKESSLE